MHSLTLVATGVPEIPEILLAKKTKEDLIISARLEDMRKWLVEDPENNMLKLAIARLAGQHSIFARAVNDMVDAVMKPYCECTEDPNYLQFVDETEELRADYENKVADCVKLPNGSIVTIYDSSIYGKYVIRDGLVYQKNAGPLQHEQRTKRAKRLTALPQYPLKKVYRTFEAFAEKYACCEFHDEYNAYGYYTNPNAFWDWYSIGGRWPFLFLVKNTCLEYSIGCRNLDYESPDAPDGYRWVCAARKRDIAWDVMLEVRKQTEIAQYQKYKEYFSKGTHSECHPWTIKEDGLFCFGDLLYAKGETLEQYLHRKCLGNSIPYLVFAHSYLSWDSEYHEQEMQYGTSAEEIAKNNYEWQKEVCNFIEGLSPEMVLVGVDCHI